MPKKDDPDLLELLKAELSFLEQGGYGRSVRTPWRPTLAFRDSPTCLNFSDPARPHPCSECQLMPLVPQDQHGGDMPCHHIPLDAEGRTVENFERWGTQAELEGAMAAWLRRTIARLEQERARPG